MSNPYLDRIQVLAIRPIDKGNLKAFAEIQLGETLVISGCRIIQQPGQRAYVAMPQNESNGKYFPVITALDKRFKAAVEEKVLAAWDGA